MDTMKKAAGIESANYVKDGMIVGLGTGSTAYFMVEEVGRRIKEEGLEITAVTTSNATRIQAQQLGIPLKSIDEVPYVDLTIDGADEISADFQGIKGGGAALLFEKIVATYSKKVIWIVDESKMAHDLGKFPLPVEVIPYGSQQVFNIFKEKGYDPSMRMGPEREFVRTDSNNYIIDLHLKKITDPHQLALELDTMVGVVEHGLFLDTVQTVIVGGQTGVRILQNPKQISK